MRINTFWFGIVLAVLLGLANAMSINAQAVLFPMQEQPGSAVVSESDGVYTLSNNLLSARYAIDGGHLIFDGCEALGLKAGSDLFSVTLGNKQSFTSSQMTMGPVKIVPLTPDETAARGSEKIAGHAVEATFSHDNLTVVWRAVLRDGSHYLRTEMELSSSEPLQMSSITPMNYTVLPPLVGMPETVGNTRGSVLASDCIFAGVESPMGLNTCGGGSVVDPDFKLKSWDAGSFDWLPAQIPAGILDMGYESSQIAATAGYAKFAQTGRTVVTFTYKGGTHRLNIVGVDLVNLDGEVVSSDYHYGYTGNLKDKNTYTIEVPQEGIYIIRYFMETRTETITSNGTISFNRTVSEPAPSELPDVEQVAEAAMTGVWERPAELLPGRIWKISSVVGLIAPGQARRSLLAYIERERAVPWRSFPHYNSWYELNIDRNNSPTYANHMTIDDCVRVTKQWKTNLFDNYGVGIQAMVWDDGWDNYGTWTFNPNFPDGFTAADEVARTMNAGMGAWLGPVGGYGASGNARRAYWTNRGGMTLGNPEYYQVFLDACTNMLNDYDFRFFKFDGISAQWTSVGPDAGAAGIEKAEGIIQLEQDVRAIKPDLFLNTTVGTWASPFWFRYTDAVWRQENDWGAVAAKGAQAACNDRERWITYRDRLVYQNFVQLSPLCPINTMMTHGFILTKYGSVSKDMSYRSIVNELRCAFACGSGMVELYADYALLNKAYSDGSGKSRQLWGEIAELIKWHEANADVLPDIHWVGGNPYDESTGNGQVYGWGAWNGKRCVLTLRNPNGVATKFEGTLREALDIPAYVTDDIILTPSFADQGALAGLPTGEAVGLDTPLSLTLPANGVFIYEGTHTQSGIGQIDADPAQHGIYDLRGIKVQKPSRGAYIVNGRKVIY